jgi:ABC-2 type transport system permease protein
MGLYLSYLKMLLKTQLQYRVSFFLLLLGQTVVPLLSLAGVALLFDRFGSLAGWTVEEAFLCFGVTHMAFALATCFARGFDTFSSIVVNGEFDRILVRPRSTVLQILGARMDFTRLGRLVQGAVLLAWSASAADIAWTPLRALTLAGMVFGGSVVFSGVYILAATLCFKTIQGIEMANIFTDGGREIAQYPLSIYPRNLVRFFTYIIPFATFNYIPLLWILGRDGIGAFPAAAAPWLGSLFILPCLLLWRTGVRKYLSTGS